MPATAPLTPAADLAATNLTAFPNESAEYRAARQQLLIAEIELRRHNEQVAALRRALPPGGPVPKDYAFEGAHGVVTLRELFADKDTLVIYSYMFGPQRGAPCPVCTSTIATWQSKAADLQQRIAFAVVARSPYTRLAAWQQHRGWQNVPLYSDPTGDFTRAYVSKDDEDVPGLTVFSLRDGAVRHFWSGELSGTMADPGQDPRGPIDIDPLWLWLDVTPEGRGTDWYPKLDYTAPAAGCCNQGDEAIQTSA